MGFRSQVEAEAFRKARKLTSLSQAKRVHTHEQARERTMLELMDRLKKLNTDRETLEDLVVLMAVAKMVRSEYTSAEIDVPDWLSGAIDTLDGTVRAKSRDLLQLRLKEIEQAEAGLLSAAEKRQKLQSEKDRLQRRLGVAPVTQ